MSVVVFGASGFLGGQLRSYFERQGQTVIGTYNSNPAPGLKRFDLRHVDLATLGPDVQTARYGIVCCSTTNMDRCRLEWDATYHVNVEGNIALITQLHDAGIVPVFISTDYVYDGSRGRYSEDDPRRPVLAYGRQKKEVEDFLLGTGRPFMVIRTGRIYGLDEDDATLVTCIAASLRRGATLKMAADQVFSPSYVLDLCRGIGLLMADRSCGCYNLGPDSPISRFALAKLIKSRLDISTGDVIPCRLAEIPFGDRRPLDTSLDNRRFVQATGYRFATIPESVERLRALSSPDRR